MKLGLTQFGGFVTAGGLATIVNYALFLTLLSQGSHYLLAASMGYVSGIGVSYLVNRLVVFRSKQKSLTESVRYFLLYLVGLLFQLIALEVLVSLGVVAEFANVLAIAAVVVINFFLIRRFVFEHRKPHESPSPRTQARLNAARTLQPFLLPNAINWIGLVWILGVGAVGTFRLIRIHTLDGNSWITSDWLINYEGGFVRRGLVGEILLSFSDYFGVGLVLLTGIFISILWVAYLGVISALWWKKEQRGVLDLVVLLSPAFVAFNVWDFQGGFRKELLLLFFLGAFSLRYRKEHRANPGIFEAGFWATLYVVGALTHEIFIFAIPMVAVLIVLHHINGGLTKSAMWTLLATLFSTISVTSVVLLGSLGTVDQQAIICSAIVDRGYDSALCGGAIRFIGAEAALSNAGIEHLIIYIGLAGLAALPFFGKRAVNLNLGLLFLGVTLSLLPLFLIAADWGRWIYVVASFISVVDLRFGEASQRALVILRKLSTQRVVALSALALWVFGWSIPHYAAEFFGPGVVNILGGFL